MSMQSLMQVAEASLYPKKAELPSFCAGNTIRVSLEITDGERKRVQKLEGVVIQVKGASYATRTFTLKKESHGVNVFFTFPLASPRILGIEVLQEGHRRRARLFFLKERKGRAARLKHER